MRDDSRTNTEVRRHIERENGYTAQATRHLADLEATLEKELEFYHGASLSDPHIFNVYLKDEYMYYSKRVTNQAYAIHCRSLKCQNFKAIPGTESNQEEVILDENNLVDFHAGFLSIHSVVPSPSNKKVAFSVDMQGNELYTIHVQDIDTGAVTTIDYNTSGNVVWGQTDQSLHYIRHDPATMFRPSQWMEWTYHRDTEGEKKKCQRNETDAKFWCHVKTTSDKEYVLWACEGDGEHKIWAMNANSGNIGFIYPFSKENGTANASSWYDVDHGMGAWWMIASQDGTETNSLYTSNDAFDGPWRKVDWLGHLGNLLDITTLALESLKVFRKHIVLYGRHCGLTQIWIFEAHISRESDESTTLSLKTATQLGFDENPYYVAPVPRQDFDSNQLLLTFESLVTPQQLLAISLDKPSQREIVYERLVPEYNSSHYTCTRLEVLSRDNATRIPISIVYRTSSYKQRPCPAHLFGYGAYGHSLDPSFSTVRVPLLNRGVVCVLAHVRGGGELGRKWQQNGSHLHKRNSINDFVDVAEHLVQERWTTPDLLGVEGRSAGGILIGGALNEAPELFQTAVLVVPFLDPLTSMADSLLPLTSLEYSEWGNPYIEQDFHVMKQWSPIQNIKSNRKYPNMLALGGLNDERVQFWQPLKYAAMIRRKADPGVLVCVKIDPDAGHSVGGNQKKYFQIMGKIYAFFLDQVGAA
jgi:oligopeptidase B